MKSNALIKVAAFGALGIMGAGSLASWQEIPPPPPTYDPQPGPYTIFISDDGTLANDQRQFVDGIFDRQHDGGYDAFLLCPDIPLNPEDYEIYDGGLKEVASRLKQAGAKSVSIGSAPLCEAATKPRNPDHKRVMIWAIETVGVQ